MNNDTKKILLTGAIMLGFGVYVGFSAKVIVVLTKANKTITQEQNRGE